MKKSALVLSSLLSISAMAASVRVPVEDTFIPKGFDSNDAVEVVISGYLPNLCYQSPQAKIVGNSAHEIEIEVTANYNSDLNEKCAEMIVPFTETVSVGVLEAGKYEIVVNKDTKKKNTLTGELYVEPQHTTAVDENIYAHVDHVKKDYDADEITIQALNPSDCLAVDGVKFVSNGINTYSVLPIMKRISDFCPLKMVPMEIKAKMPHDLNKNKILLHVRSMEGKSYNTIYSQEQ